MDDEEFKKELKELNEMLENLRRIKDKGYRRKFKAHIRAQLAILMQD